MTEMTEEERLELRIENWGRWCRDTHQPGHTNCLGIRINAPIMSGDDPPPPPVDIKDALLVNRAWEQMMWTGPLRIFKALIAVRYAYPQLDFDRLRYYLFKVYHLRLQERDYESTLRKARKMLRNNIVRLDKVENQG